MRPHLRDLDIVQLPALFRAAGLERPAYWAQRLAVSIHRHGATEWNEFEIGRRVRGRLEQGFRFGPLLEHVAERQADDGTRKDVYRLEGGELIETVLLRNIVSRTLCVSSQSGCGLGCTFCATGRLGLRRSLSPGEISESIVRAQHLSGERVGDVVFMGQGEPLQNYDAVMTAAANIQHEHGMCMGRKHITISTVGLTPQIRRFTRERRQWRLDLSLHSAIQETRETLMPIARTHPLPELLDAMGEFQRVGKRRFLTFQYVAIPDVNMDDAHVDALARELVGLRYVLNVIPWNETGADYRTPTWAEVKDFTKRLRRLQCPVKIRYSGGKHEGMGCGQLAGARAAGG